jgi:phosphatidate cytidylyltransferase
MLRQRVITALILAIIGLSALFLLPAPAFAVAAALLLAGAGGWEAARLAGLDANGQRIAVALVLLGVCLALLLWLPAAAATGPCCPPVRVWLLNMAWLTRPHLGETWPGRGIAGKLAVLVSSWRAPGWRWPGCN